MSSAGENRSLTTGIPIPQWMKSKAENYGFDPSTLSPPTHESDFFYVKYQKPPKQTPEPLNLKSLNEVIEVKERAFNKHTDSCKQFIPKIQDTVRTEKPKIKKPMGVDDGFIGEGAACGASVVEVAHQMLTGKGRNLRSLARLDPEETLTPSSSVHVRTRRNSKSLPVSPVTSPGGSPLTSRKNPSGFQNRLFGINFQSVESNLCESEENLDKKSGSSWILSSLFAYKDSGRDSGRGMDSGKEEGKAVARKESGRVANRREEDGTDARLKESVNANVVVDVSIAPSSGSSKGSFFKSKPYFRDLNLLTPSSS